VATPLVNVIRRLYELDERVGRAMPQAHRLILLCIAEHQRDNAYAWPSVATLARFACIDKRDARRYLRDLERECWIRSTRRSIGGEQSSSGYELTPGTGRPFGSSRKAPERGQVPGGDATPRGSRPRGCGVQAPGGGGSEPRGVRGLAPSEETTEKTREETKEEIHAACGGVVAPPDGGRDVGGPWGLCSGDPDEHAPPPPTARSPEVPPTASGGALGPLGATPDVELEVEDAQQPVQAPRGEAIATPDACPVVQGTIPGLLSQPGSATARAAKPGPRKARTAETKPPKPPKGPTARERYKAAYEAGMRDAAPDARFVLAGSFESTLGPTLTAHARDAEGNALRGPELDAWLRARVAAFRRDTADESGRFGGWAPYGFQKWLNEGAEKRQRFGQGGGRPFLKQPYNGMPAAVVQLRPEEYEGECPL
jgi:hypothetical protein